MRWILRFLRSDEGVTAVEYAVMLSMIVMACLVAIGTLTENVRSNFEDTATKISTAITTSS